MGLTTGARHMITTLRPLDGRLATRTGLDLMRTNVLVKCAVNLVLAIVAGNVLMVLHVAVRTNAH